MSYLKYKWVNIADGGDERDAKDPFWYENLKPLGQDMAQRFSQAVDSEISSAANAKIRNAGMAMILIKGSIGEIVRGY